MQHDTIVWITTFGIVLVFSILIISFYYYIDEFEPENISDLSIGVGIGILTIIPVYLIYSFLNITNEFVFGVITAPIIEELIKAVFLLILIRRDHVDGPIDGFIYGAMLGIGFSFGENLLYGMITYYSTGSVISGVTTVSIRSLLSIIGHPLYTGLFGLGLGKFKVNAKESILDEFGLALGAHILWNFTVQIENSMIRLPITFVVVILLFTILYKKLEDGLKLDQYAHSHGYYKKKDILIAQDKTDKISDLEYPLEDDT